MQICLVGQPANWITLYELPPILCQFLSLSSKQCSWCRENVDWLLEKVLTEQGVIRGYHMLKSILRQDFTRRWMIGAHLTWRPKSRSDFTLWSCASVPKKSQNCGLNESWKKFSGSVLWVIPSTIIYQGRNSERSL